MITSFLKANETDIFFQQSGDSKSPAVIFIHGASISSQTWYHQFADEQLRKNFCLYAFDLPGHRQSGKLKNAEGYSLKGLGKTIVQIIEQLQLKEYILVTLSLAGNIVAESVGNLKGCKGIFMAGPSLLGKNFPVTSLLKPYPYTHLLTSAKATKDELNGYARYVMHHPSEKDIRIFSEDYENTDPNFRLIIGKVLTESDYSDEVEIMKESVLPLALVYGKEEAIVQPLYLQNAGFNLWKNKIHLIEKAGHLVNIDSKTTFNEYLSSFAKDAFK